MPISASTVGRRSTDEFGCKMESGVGRKEKTLRQRMGRDGVVRSNYSVPPHTPVPTDSHNGPLVGPKVYRLVHIDIIDNIDIYRHHFEPL